MPSNCGAGEASWESLGLQGDQTSHKGNQSWILIGRTDAEAEAPILWPPDVNWRIWKDPDAGIEGRRRREWQKMRWLDGITDSRTWVRASSGRWWRTEKPGVLQSMGWQRVAHDWATARQQSTNLYLVTFLTSSSPDTHSTRKMIQFILYSF